MENQAWREINRLPHELNTGPSKLPTKLKLKAM